MNKLFILGTSLAVLLSAGVVMAGDEQSTEAPDTVVFQSLGSVPSEVMPMTDDALEATEGKGNACFFVCGTAQGNFATINQNNVSFLSAGIAQQNNAAILQSNSN
jgi:hypothetical protein